jgi:hypothetical protein
VAGVSGAYQGNDVHHRRISANRLDPPIVGNGILYRKSGEDSSCLKRKKPRQARSRAGVVVRGHLWSPGERARYSDASVLPVRRSAGRRCQAVAVSSARTVAIVLCSWNAQLSPAGTGRHSVVCRRGGTEGSNPPPSSGESGANLISKGSVSNASCPILAFYLATLESGRDRQCPCRLLREQQHLMAVVVWVTEHLLPWKVFRETSRRAFVCRLRRAAGTRG